MVGPECSHGIHLTSVLSHLLIGYWSFWTLATPGEAQGLFLGAICGGGEGIQTPYANSAPKSLYCSSTQPRVFTLTLGELLLFVNPNL